MKKKILRQLEIFSILLNLIKSEEENGNKKILERLKIIELLIRSKKSKKPPDTTVRIE